MDKETKRRLLMLSFGILAIILLLVGVSFAAFSSNIIGQKEHSMKTGCLKVQMSDNGSINMTNQAPKRDQLGLESTPYTYTLTNTCTIDASYITTINVLTGSNLDNISKIKLSLSGDSYLEPVTQNTLKESDLRDETESNIQKTYVLDEGTLAVGESKTFNLRSWIDYDVTNITGKLENKVIVYSEALHNKAIAYSTNSAAYQVFKDKTLLSNSEYSYDTIADKTGAIKVLEDGNLKYYMRGNPNNYISFGNIPWRVMSSNSDGSINIAYARNILPNSTYAGLNTTLDSLYAAWKLEERYIKTSSTFCEEKAVNNTYVSKLRVTNFNPTTKCQSNNYFTKIGIVSADDLMYAGASAGKVNPNFYLAGSDFYFTGSHYSADKVYAYTRANSILEMDKTVSIGVRPVITLSKDAMIEGEGTAESPYYVSRLYQDEKPIDTSDKVAPTIVFAKVDEAWSRKDKTIRISARDDVQGSGIAGYIVKTTNNKPSLTDTAWEASSSITYNTVNSYGNGTYYVFVKDAGGNISDSTKVVIDKVDTVAPTCSISVSPNGSETAYKTLTITSTNTDINKNAYSWDHASTNADVIKVSENMVYTGYIRDLAGNVGKCSATVTSIKKPVIDVEPKVSGADMLIERVGTGGLQAITHAADSTLQIGDTSAVTEYRYRGKNVNNYVNFNNETWRIIGVFPVDDGTGNIENRIKLIRNEFIDNLEWNIEGTNNWTDASLRDDLASFFDMYSEKYRDMVSDAKYYLGGGSVELNAGYPGLYFNDAASWYLHERKSSSYCYPGNDTYSVDKLGLMYVSDYMYAATGCDDKPLYNPGDDDIAQCNDSNWIYDIQDEWFINHTVDYENSVFVRWGMGNGGVLNANEYLAGRPVLYLSSDVQIDNSFGTAADPIELSK